MKNFLKALIIVFIVGILTACMNTNNDGKQSETNEQNEPNDRQTEEEFDQDNPDKERDYDRDKDNRGRNKQGENNRNKDRKHHHERSDRTPTNESNQKEIVLENDAFQIFEPAPKARVKDKIVVRGLASVPEGNIHYTFENCHSILDEGSITASKAAPDWGEFEFTIEIDKPENCSAKIVLSEDGSKTNELIIPVHIKR